MSKRKTKGKKIFIAAVVIAAIAAISALIPESVWNTIFIKTGLRQPEYKSAPMSVHFVDVGQGDCTVITTEKGETVLIDSGEEIKSDTVINYLHSLSVDRIDYCIVTHPHSDHYGGMLNILKEFNADRVIMPRLSDINTPTDDYYSEFMSHIKSECSEVKILSSEYNIELQNVKLHILPPVTQREDLNDMSLIVKASYGNSSILITGDCSEDEEEDILEKYSSDELKSDVLKLGHHGSKNATGENWLKAVNPSVCVISAGKYNSYNLPSNETLERLENRNIEYYRTDICGTLVFNCDEKGITLE